VTFGDAFVKADKNSGVKPGAATLDDIRGFIAERRLSEHGTIRPLGPLAQERAFVQQGVTGLLEEDG
jgi:hypothetical protein